jgi:hypothetical protein
MSVDVKNIEELEFEENSQKAPPSGKNKVNRRIIRDVSEK